MIETAVIENFRCFEHVSLSDCKLLNVVVGQNASGKTALLEGLFLALGHTPDVIQRFRVWRGLEQPSGNPVEADRDMWREILNGLDLSKTAKVSIVGTDQHTRSVEVSFDRTVTVAVQSAPSFPFTVPSFVSPVRINYENGVQQWSVSATYAGGSYQYNGMVDQALEAAFFASAHIYNNAENTERFSQAVRAGKESELVEAISSTFSFISGIRILSKGGTSSVHVDTPWFEEPVPITYISSGVSKFITLILTISAMEGGIILIDEIENGFHFSILRKVWKTIIDLASAHNVQIFASTHSWECLSALHEVIGDRADDLSLIRAVPGADGAPSIEQYHGTTMLAAIESDREIRS